MPKRNFNIGDVVRVVRGESKKWVIDVPLRVVELSLCGMDEFIVVTAIDGSDPSKPNFRNHVRKIDCEPNFLAICREAIKKGAKDAR